MDPRISHAFASEPVWDSLRRLQRVQVYGAGRAIGREVTAELLRHGHPVGLLQLYGRREAAFSWQSGTLHVGSITGREHGAELAFVCTDAELGRQLVPMLLARGTRVVDLSGGYAEDGRVALVVDELNGSEIGAFTQQVSIPFRSTYALARLLALIAEVSPLVEVDVFAVLAAATAGMRGMRALRDERSGTDLQSGTGSPQGALPQPARVGNLLPVDPALEERCLREWRRVLGRPDLLFELLASIGDAERCDAFAVKVRVASAVDPAAIAEIFQGARGIQLVATREGPLPAACRGTDQVHVGRIRAGTGGPGSLCFFAVADQLRAGAAAAALNVACRFPACS